MARVAAVRGLAAAFVPLAAAVAYLASSRGGFATAAVGALALLVLSDRRWEVGAAGVVAGAGAVVAVAVVRHERALTATPIDRAAAIREGHRAALAVAIICVGVAVCAALATAAARRIHAPRSVGVATAVVAAVAAVALLVAAHPVRRFQAFKALPGGGNDPNFVQAHLLSSSGSGRWQFWTAAVDEFRSRPVIGQGAGSYEPWWARHATISAFVRDAHSLYLQTAGELGVLGIVSLACILVGGVWLGARALRSADDRTTAAALAATAAAFAFAASFDWVWELSAVAFVGLAALGVLSGRPAGARQVSVAARVAVAVVAALLILPQLLVYRADSKLADSRRAVARGDVTAAVAAARDARRLEPWAASPPLQLALVAESAQRLRDARGWIDQAIARDGQDWRLWLVAARLQTRAGDIADARESLRRARELYPRSPLLRTS
jgi:O-antigen ligase